MELNTFKGASLTAFFPFLTLILTIAVLNPEFAMGSAISKGADEPSKIEISAKSIEFKATTDRSIVVPGRSISASGTLELSKSEKGVNLMNIKISIPVDKITTGIGVRDNHMQNFITDEGKFPSITFDSSLVNCAGSSSESKLTCQAEGIVGLQGKNHKYTLPISVEKTGSKYEASADFKLLLSDFKIERPSHFGITVDDSIEIKTVFYGESAPNLK